MPETSQPYRRAFVQDRLADTYTANTRSQLEANLDRIYKLIRGINDNGELPAGTENDLLVFIDGVWTVIPFVATNQRVIGNSTGAPAWEQVSLTAGVSGRLPFANLATVAESRLLGRGQGAGAGDAQEIELGAGLSMTGTTLSATGGGGTGHWSPVMTGISLTGDPEDSEMVLDADGDCIMALIP